MPRLHGFRQHDGLKALEGRIEWVDRHLDRVKRVAKLNHSQVELRIFMASEAGEANLALLLRLVHRLEHATLGVRKVRVVVPGHAVHLPKIQIIGLKPAERLLEHLQAKLGAAAVRADLGHEKYFVAMALESMAQPVFSAAVVIFPAVVEEGNPTVDCGMNCLDGVVNRFIFAEVMTSHSECGNLHIGVPAEGPLRDVSGALGLDRVMNLLHHAW